eukprot:6483608-Amphidinium_carterae.1
MAFHSTKALRMIRTRWTVTILKHMESEVPVKLTQSSLHWETVLCQHMHHDNQKVLQRFANVIWVDPEPRQLAIMSPSEDLFKSRRVRRHT